MADTTDLLTGIYFGEGPRWRDDKLWFSDFYSHTVHRLSMDGTVEDVMSVPQQPSGLGWMPNGDLLVVSMGDLTVLRVAPDGTTSVHADISHLGEHLANDMLVDAEGRAYVGNFGFDLDGFLEEHGPEGLDDPGTPSTNLALVQPDGSVEVAASDIAFPNGTVITSDGSTLILAETLGLKLTAFDIGEDGKLHNRRVWADLSGDLVLPDGIAIDSEDGVWVANAVGAHAVRVLDGAIVDRVETSQPCFAVALGGPDAKTLFCCTAPDSRVAVASAEPRGKIEIAKVEVPA